MIKIELRENKIICSGHANYADYGKDIVCSSVSSIIFTTINGIFSLENSIDVNKKENEIIITIKEDTLINKKLLENMLIMIEELSDKYPKNIQINK